MRLPKDARLVINSVKLCPSLTLKANSFEIEYSIFSKLQDSEREKPIYSGSLVFPIEGLDKFDVNIGIDDVEILSEGWDLAISVKKFAEKLVAITEEFEFEISSQKEDI